MKNIRKKQDRSFSERVVFLTFQYILSLPESQLREEEASFLTALQLAGITREMLPAEMPLGRQTTVSWLYLCACNYSSQMTSC